MSRVLVAMSGGVDSSVAAALLLEAGHDVVGATMKLWGGESDSGCCSVADVEDARRVAHQLGIAHHVFNFGADFDDHVVQPYVASHAAGRTPNPCIECNRHLKFDRFLVRATQLGFDRIATGHHARVVAAEGGRYELRRGVDAAKDQSYVLHMLDQGQLSRCLLPVGEMTKAEVRERALALALRTAMKPDSQDVCFITSTAGREQFLGDRIPLRSGRMVDLHSGEDVGEVPAIELVTVGQRRGLGDGGGRADRRYAVAVDVTAGLVTVGTAADVLRSEVRVAEVAWTDAAVADGTRVLVQASAHGRPAAGTWTAGLVCFDEPQRAIAPGQSVVLYRADVVLGGGIAQP